MSAVIVDKNQPGDAWIASLSQRFPCEREVDRFLTRKLKTRFGGAFKPVTLEQLVGSAQALMAAKLAMPFEISEARWLSGGASKLQMVFTLSWTPPGRRTAAITRMVVRMEPAESICESSRQREFEIIEAVRGVVPVPEAFWYDADGTYFPYPAIIYAFAEGVAKPTAPPGSISGISGVGTFFPPALRQPIGTQFIEHLARIHAFDWRGAKLESFDVPATGVQAVEWELNHWERLWESDVNRDVALMRLAMAWLRNHVPPVDHISVVHGDYRTGNFLFTEHDNRISAVLDWEMAYLGDRHADLAWATNPVLGNYAEDGKTFLCGGLLPREELFARYEKASGFRVVPDSLTFYDIFGAYKIIVICLATGYRAATNARTHQDVLVGWLTGISYSMLEDLRTKLEKVL